MRLHHIGMATSNIDEQARRMQELLGFKLQSPPVVDPLQQVRVAFVGTNTDVSIELIEPLDEASPVARFLAKEGVLHHLCYAVPDLDKAIDHLYQAGSLLVSEPKPAVALHGQRVAFLYTRDRQLVELFEEVTL